MLYDLNKESEKPGFDEVAQPITVTLDPIDVETIGATFEAYFRTLAILDIPVPENVRSRAGNVMLKLINELAKQGDSNAQAQGQSHTSVS